MSARSCPQRPGSRAVLAAALLALGSAAIGAVGAAADESRFSPLADIDRSTIARLELAFAFRTGSPRGHAGSAEVSGGLILVQTPFPHALYTLDLAQGGRVRWAYRPELDRMAEGLATDDAVNAGPTVDGDRVYLTRLDGHVVALAVETGRVVWDAAPARPALGETLAGRPLVADGRVFVGGGGDAFGARGWVAALDAATGRELWRRFSTGPDAEVGIGPDFRHPDPDDADPERGVRTWPPSGWEHGGGAVSGPLLLDRELGLLIHGTGRPAPADPGARPGANRWTSGLFARDVATGSARWFRPLNPHDPYGYGATAPNLLVDREQDGAPRKLLVHPGADGLLSVIDRVTGRVLSARIFVPSNASAAADPAMGGPRRGPAEAPRFQVTSRDVCPGRTGAVGGAAAYSPLTGLVYLPVSRLCMDIEMRNATYLPGTPFDGANVRLKAPREGGAGALIAWDLEAGRPAWTVPERFPLAGGVLATAGGLVIYGTLDGALKAVDAGTGALLWRAEASSGIIGDPTTFRGPDGRQYLAVLAGRGGPLGRAGRHGIDLRDATAAGGAGNALGGLPKPRDESGTLSVFRLP